MKTLKLVLNRNGCKPLWDCPAILREDMATQSPVVYLKKPKGASDEDFNKTVDYIFQKLNPTTPSRDNGK